MSNLQSLEQRMDRVDYKVISDDKDKQLADLEAKLAERKEFCISQTQSLLDINNALIEENNELKQQLAEKDKELKYKTAECEKWKADYQNCSRLEKSMSKEHQYCLDNWRASEQDKISFAVEQLEKVKEFVEKRISIITENYEEELIDGVRYSDMWYENKEVLKEIHNQIEELKKGET